MSTIIQRRISQWITVIHLDMWMLCPTAFQRILVSIKNFKKSICCRISMVFLIYLGKTLRNMSEINRSLALWFVEIASMTTFKHFCFYTSSSKNFQYQLHFSSDSHDFHNKCGQLFFKELFKLQLYTQICGCYIR